MKLIAPLLTLSSATAFINNLSVDFEQETPLVRVKRNTREKREAVNWESLSSNEFKAAMDAQEDGDGFQCILRTPALDSAGNEVWFVFEYVSIHTRAQCDAEKTMFFEIECETDCGPDEQYDCDSASIQACVNAQFMMGRSMSGGPGRKLGVRYTRWKAVARMIAHIVAKPTLKKKDVIKKMLNYGCHCFPGGKKDRSVGGKGPAMDEIDGVCRTQYQCHKCVEMEFGCNPDETPYKAQFKGKKTALQKEVICRDDLGSCARSMCDCDKRMAENLEKIWFVPDSHNAFFWGERKNRRKRGKAGLETFDYEGTCTNTGMSPVPDTCCGSHPNVVPYNAATKDCCVQNGGPKLFDPLTHMCCAGGLIATAGSC